MGVSGTLIGYTDPSLENMIGIRCLEGGLLHEK